MPLGVEHFVKIYLCEEHHKKVQVPQMPLGVEHRIVPALIFIALVVCKYLRCH